MISAVAGGPDSGPPATALDLLQIATLSGAALLTWFHLNPSGHPALLPLVAVIVGGSSILKRAIDDVAARRVTTAVSVTIVIGAELAVGELAAALITALAFRLVSIVGEWATARMVDTIDRGQRLCAPIEDAADRLSRVLVYCGLSAAAVTLLVTRDVRTAASVAVVVTCGVGRSARVAVSAAVARSLGRGAIVQGGRCLEALWSCDTVVLGSTASMVFDEPVVSTIYPATGVSVHDVLKSAAIAERVSNHPIGRAIVRSAAEKRLTVPEPGEFSLIQGCGVRAVHCGEEILVGSTAFVTEGRLAGASTDASSVTVFVVRGGRYLGAIALAKRPRPDATRAIAGLKSLAIQTHLLTDDSRIAAEPIARELKVDDFEPDLGPAERGQRVRDLMTRRRVAMVGDAIEDAAALEAAHVGITIEPAIATADTTADVMLPRHDFGSLVDVVCLARRAHRVIVANITGTLLVDVTGVALAAAGVLSPVVAVLVRAGAELACLFNALRLASE